MNPLMECSLRMAAGAAIVAGLLWMLRIRAAATRHAAWAVVMLAMLISPVMPRLAVPILPAAEKTVLITRALEFVPEPMVETAMPVAAATAEPVDWIPVLYWLGFSAMAARLAFATWRLRGLTSAQIAVPVTIGLLRPRPLLPDSARNWAEPLRRMAVAHEQAHVRRCDPLIQWLAHLNRAVFWFHPLAWIIVRHLERLAEQACDDAVLAEGHEASEYAEVLVEMGRSVRTAGGVLAMTGSPLNERVERILSGLPAVAGPAPRTTALMAGAIVLCLAACQPAQRSKARLPGEPTMNELMHRRAKEHRWESPLLAPADVGRLEASLRTNPGDHATRSRLLTHYYQANQVKDQNRLVLWAIEHAPESPSAQHFIHLDYIPEDYRRGKQLWLTHLRPVKPSATVLANAARYFEPAEKPASEQIIFRGQALYPEDPNWRGLLVSLYYQGLAGSNAPLELRVVRRVGRDAATLEFAAAVKKKLDQSQDATLLAQVGSRLVHFGPSDPSLRQLAKSYLDRAAAIQPNIPSVALSKEREALEETYLLLRTKGPEEALRSATGTQRVRLQLMIAQRLFIKNDMTTADRHARELLRSASGAILFDANLLLGKVALRKGDKRTARRYLAAAAQVPPDETMKQRQVTMELPRSLVDWGERDAVADFLEHIATYNTRKVQLAEWARLIREGRNPDLIPLHTGCPNEPC